MTIRRTMHDGKKKTGALLFLEAYNLDPMPDVPELHDGDYISIVRVSRWNKETDGYQQFEEHYPSKRLADMASAWYRFDPRYHTNPIERRKKLYVDMNERVQKLNTLGTIKPTFDPFDRREGESISDALERFQREHPDYNDDDGITLEDPK